MRKIANTTELAGELQRILDYAGSVRPSRVKLAADLSSLAMRVAAKAPKPKFKMNEKVKVLKLVPGTKITGGSTVEIIEIGKRREQEPRYKVKAERGGEEAWVYEDNLES